MTATKLVCSVCGKQYQRASHLRRHEATHLESDKFPCAHCDKSFARRDVWRKHLTRCSNADTPPPAKRGRKQRSCDECFRRRQACSNDQPCRGCQSRQVTCTYDRSPSVVSDKVSVSFLLSLTDPKAESMVSSLLEESDHHVAFDSFTDLVFDEGFLSWPLVLPSIDWPIEPIDFICGMPSPTEPSLEIIINELHALHMRLEDDKLYDGTFDVNHARCVFTTENRQAFIANYYRYTHIDFPITHQPSFDPATVSPVLLLILFLCGSMYVPKSSLAMTRGFFRIAEEYVFRQLEELMGIEGKPGESALLYETLQAALLIHCLQYSMRDEVTRRRNRTKRLPALVSAVRTLGLPQVTHSEPGWRQFIQQETKLRIATWTLLGDWHQSGMFHQPPLLTIYEFRGDFPCLPELWDAKTETEFNTILAARPDSWKRSSSIRGAVEALLADSWSGTGGFPLRNVTAHDLHLLVYAVHCVARSAGFTLLGSLGAPSIFRATTRWQEMWAVAAGPLSEEQLRGSGLARYSPEMCWLMRKMIEAAMTGDKRLTESKYYQGVAHDSLEELHSLIREFRDL